MAKTKKELKIDEYVAQAIQEIEFARRHKQGKIKNWQKNEDMYYAKKVPTDSSRANVDLARGQEFVRTLLSKIDNSIFFKFIRRKLAQHKRVEKLNSLRTYDASRDDWDIKDLAGKTQMIIYGRAIYCYYADSYEGYKPHLDPVDVYDFLIDPSAGGIDIEKARYMGHYGVVKTKEELEEGVSEGVYLKKQVSELLKGNGNANESTQEETNKQNRAYGQNTDAKKEINSNEFKFWQWITTDKDTGERIYLLMSATMNTAVRCEKLKDMFSDGLFPYWTYAAVIDLVEFWTPSFFDFVREIFMAQAVSVNQLLDNGEQINKPQKIVNVSALENLAELKYRREGIIKVKKDVDANKAIQFVQTSPITTAVNVYNLLEQIQEKSSGVTAGSKGVSDEDGKVGIYEGNQENVADRFGLVNKSYSFGYKRFAMLYLQGVKDHLKKKIAIEILGPDGVEVDEVSARDLIKKGEDYGIIVESSNAESALSIKKQAQKMSFLTAQAANPEINQKKLFEMQASIVGLQPDEIKLLLDKEGYGSTEVMAEADRDIEDLLEGKKIKPNQIANTAYKQRFVDYMQDNEEKIDAEQFRALADYVLLLDPIITRNMTRKVTELSAQSALQNIVPQMGNENGGQEAPIPGADMPTPDTMGQV